MIQRNHVDELAQQIKANQNLLLKEIEHNPVAVDHRKVESHNAETDFMEFFENNFARLRAEFNGFLAKWM